LKVILAKDYEKLGNAGDIINVKDGFAKNYLIPNNIVLLLTQGNINQMEIVKKSLIKKDAGNIAEAKKLLELIDNAIITIKVNSSPEGRLFGSITNKDVAEKILEVKKIELDRKKIELEEHIKEVGTYKVTIKLYKDVKASIQLEIVSDDVVAAEEKAEEIDLEKAVEKDLEKAVEKDLEKAEEKTEENALEKAVERDIEIAEEKADKKADKKAQEENK
jgi:large subunit ribosomal protein L9